MPTFSASLFPLQMEMINFQIVKMDDTLTVPVCLTSLMYAESISAWSNQGSIMRLLSILNIEMVWR